MYIFEINRVVWIEDIQDEAVTLTSINESHNIEPQKLARLFEEGKVCIESQPPI